MSHDHQHVLQTATGEFSLQEYRLRHIGREWTVLHTRAVLTLDDEAYFFRELRDRLPYGLALWPAAIALAHEIAARADRFVGAGVLELGAGTGLPGIVAATLGADVVQTDRHPTALDLCRRNGARNAVTTITYRVVDWEEWNDTNTYDWIIGSDILYDAAMHSHLRRIMEMNLAVGGRVLLTDPFREVSLGPLEGLEASGWTVGLTKWQVGEDAAPRAIGLFELVPPSS